jgi:siroheme synthase-like protein
MSLFPIFVRLNGRLVVVVGGGTIAEGKIQNLLSAEARIRLVAPAITPQVASLVRFGKVDWVPKEFSPGDLDGAFLVIAATSASGINEAVYRESEARGILCNAVDDIEHCHYYTGAVVQRGDLQIAISTNGKSPALAQRLRLELEAQFGPEYELWLEWLGASREAIRKSSCDPESNKKLLHELASKPVFDRFVQESKSNLPNRGAS